MCIRDRVEKTPDDEIGELTDAINDMSQKLSQAERVQTEFISSVSHELRTPQMCIRDRYMAREKASPFPAMHS